MSSWTRRHPALTPALILVGITVAYFVWFALTVIVHHVPVAGPTVDIVTTRCVRPDGEMLGSMDFGEPCPSGTTADSVVVQSHLP